MEVIVSGSSLKQDKVTYDHGKIVNVHIAYEISKNLNISSYLTIWNFLFGADSLAKNVDIDKYKYSGYEIEFDKHGFFWDSSGRTGRDEIIFGVDMSSSTKTDSMKKDILILGNDPTQ